MVDIGKNMFHFVVFKREIAKGDSFHSLVSLAFTCAINAKSCFEEILYSHKHATKIDLTMLLLVLLIIFVENMLK